MAKSGARKETAAVRPPATSPPHRFPGAPTSPCANPSPPPQFFPSAPTSSSAIPSTPPHFYPTAPTSPSAIPSLNQWRPMYTPAPEENKRKDVNVDGDEPSERTAQRLTYTPEEHVRLAGAWLECSVDPIDGNGKKGEKFWDDIAALYNSTTPSSRKRDRNQLKQEWQRTKKRLGAFHGEWMALEKYEANYGHSFQHLTMWVKLRDDGKWLACYQKMIGRSPSEGNNLTSNVINLESEKRPEAGRVKARTERAGKGKAREVSQELGEKLDISCANLMVHALAAEASIIDPSSLYTLDDYLVQKDMLDSFAKEIAAEVKESLEDPARSSRSGPRNYVNRPREGAAEQLSKSIFTDGLSSKF
ncbi:hypothetical protein ACQ4PT_007849 [Festuca glaucescens]